MYLVYCYFSFTFFLSYFFLNVNEGSYCLCCGFFFLVFFFGGGGGVCFLGKTQ